MTRGTGLNLSVIAVRTTHSAQLRVRPSGSLFIGPLLRCGSRSKRRLFDVSAGLGPASLRGEAGIMATATRFCPSLTEPGAEDTS